MTHAEICPICNGTGYISETMFSEVSNNTGTRVCHGCGGTGWVTVAD